jgi:hypothetical protein
MTFSIPAKLRAGDSWSWSVVLDSYSAADGWVLGFTLLNATQRKTFAATANGSTFDVAVTAATTSAYAPAKYSWVARVARGAEVYTVATGIIDVLPDLTAVADLRSHAQKTLEAIEAVIEARATIDQEEYAINGRSLKRTPIADLLSLRDRYRRELKKEMGDSRGRKLLVRM